MRFGPRSDISAGTVLTLGLTTVLLMFADPIVVGMNLATWFSYPQTVICLLIGLLLVGWVGLAAFKHKHEGKAWSSFWGRKMIHIPLTIQIPIVIVGGAFLIWWFWFDRASS